MEIKVTDFIPQRPPFLFVDEVIDHSPTSVTATKFISGEEDFFQGHFPGNPIMPGVLLCEAAFQTGALLVGLNFSEQKGLGVVTRIESTKFKNFVRPQDLLTIKVDLKEQLQNAFFLQGKITVAGKPVLTINFTCALVK